MADGPEPISTASLYASGAMSHPSSSAGVNSIANGGDHDLLPVKSDLNQVAGNIGQGIQNPIPSQSMDSGFFAKINQENALGQSLTNTIGGVVNHLGTREAGGDQNLQLENLGQGERQSPPTVQGGIQMGRIGVLGARDGGSH